MKIIRKKISMNKNPEAFKMYRLVFFLTHTIDLQRWGLDSQFNDFFLLLLFNVPVNNFSVMLRRSHLFLGITSTFGE